MSKLYGKLEDVMGSLETADKNLGYFGLRLKVIIENKTDLSAFLKSHHGDYSYFYSNINEGFKNDDDERVLKPGKSGGYLMYRDNNFLLNGLFFEQCKGSISLLIPTDGRNYVVVLSWARHQTGRNCAEIDIRMEDGQQDARGNVSGHSVDPSGNASKTTKSCSFSNSNAVAQTFHASSAYFSVSCTFDNGWENDTKIQRLVKFTIIKKLK